MKFLVVDDISFDREVVDMCVKKLGFSSVTASNEQEMIKALQYEKPDCVLLDWEMGETNGIELLKKVRALDTEDRIKVIFCTSNDHPSYVGHAYLQGADGFIAKPISISKLSDKLQEIGLL
jgi:two-component system, chemotaxis family, chemotaxis protein CheY